MAQPVEGVVVRPGDTLVLRYEGPLTMQMAHEIQARLERALPGVRVVIVEAGQIARITAETMDEAVRLAQENPGRVVTVED